MSSSDKDEDQFEELLDKSFEFFQPSRGDILDAEILEIRDNEIVVGLGAKRDGIVPSQDVQHLDPAVRQSLSPGDTVPVYVLNPNDNNGNLIVSISLGYQGHDWVRAERLLESGELVEAEAVGQNKGGLLVRFGRLEGFVPSSHLTDTGDEPERAAGLLGQTLTLKVLEVNQSRRRLILSQREAQKNRRSQQKKKLLDDLKIGDILEGTVTGVRDFGVFVDVGGADGLVHVSELDWHRVPHPREVVTVGQKIEVYVLELDQETQRIALSLKRAKPDPWAHVTDTYHIGQLVTGVVSNVVDFGAFVVLPDGIEGLLHVTEMADGTLAKPPSDLKQGDTIEARIVRIEPERKRIGFSQRPDQPSPDANASPDVHADEPDSSTSSSSK